MDHAGTSINEQVYEFFEKFDVVCQTSGTYLALIKPSKEKDVLTTLRKKAKVKLKLGDALVKFEYEGNSLTYVAPSKLIIRLKDVGTLKEAERLVSEILGHA
ncbi:MAG: hypothetical protein QXY49_01000 [Thermofilaceae archaeon]